MNKEERTEVKKALIDMINEIDDFDNVALIISKELEGSQDVNTIIHGSKVQNYHAITSTADRVLNSLIKDVKEADDVDTVENRMSVIKELCYMGMPDPDIDVLGPDELLAFMSSLNEDQTEAENDLSKRRIKSQIMLRKRQH